MQTLISLFSVYIFIMLGFFAKHTFKEKLDEKTLVLISIYFLQPFLILWGFSSKSIDLQIIKAPLIFLFIVLVVFVFAFVLSRVLFSDSQDRSIFVVTSIIGNTGNLGIPIGLMLFGQESVIYTTFINIVNIFLVYIIGVFFYSLGNYSLKESVKNIFKLPAIWFVALAVFLNLNHFEYPKEFDLPLKMGAYATMVVQLFIFGMYLKGVKFAHVEWKSFWSINLFKFIFVPALSVLLLSLFDLDRFVYDILLLELIVPIAVMNVNLASLYECKPSKVAFLTFSTSVLFLGVLVVFVKFVF